METRRYIFKGLRRDNRGSIRLLNQGLAHYKDEVGLAPTSVVLSALRRETLPGDITQQPQTLSDGTQCTYEFSATLALNELQCSGMTPQRVLTILKGEGASLNLSYWLRKTYPSAQVKQVGENRCIVTLRQETWASSDEQFFRFLQYQAFAVAEWQRLTSEVTV